MLHTNVRPSLLLSLLLLLLVVPSAVTAAPWLAEEDELKLALSYDFQNAQREFLPEGDAQAFPLNGEFSGNRLELKGRYGISDSLELSTSLTFKQVGYTADPIILPPNADLDSVESANGSITDFTDSVIGAGDIRLGVDYQLVNLDGIFVLASETELKLPTGYDKPSGTFEGDDPLNTTEDDVTLGDGQTDITQSFSMGAFVPATSTFTELGLGFRLRFAEPGHQMVGRFKLGQFIGENVIVYGSLDGAYTVTEGEVIGKSFITRQPETPSAELAAGTSGSIEPIDLRVDRSYIQAGGGVIFRVRDFEIEAAYRQILLGNNIPAIKSASASFTYSLPSLTGRTETPEGDASNEESAEGEAQTDETERTDE